ncbi:hypothetical protein LB504_013190 [Fusarium proliferatum]|nr:hypothetical protein LB504_013190 [Fusarium proliferatum]
MFVFWSVHRGRSPEATTPLSRFGRYLRASVLLIIQLALMIGMPAITSFLAYAVLSPEPWALFFTCVNFRLFSLTFHMMRFGTPLFVQKILDDATQVLFPTEMRTRTVDEKEGADSRHKAPNREITTHSSERPRYLVAG